MEYVKKIDNQKKEPIIQIVGLNKDFTVGNEDVEVLKNINLEVFAGEFVLLFGMSGCGKSTLLNTILGLERPTSGKVFVHGDDIYNLKDDDRARFRQIRFGMVQQQSNWVGSLNIIENIAYTLMNTGIKNKNALSRAKRALEVFGLDDFAKYVPTELSGGQQQRVSICRALVANPWIIVADEPTGNLDSISAGRIMDTFKIINEKGKRTIIMVSHNLAYEKYATKLIFMEDGEIKKVVVKKKVLTDIDNLPDDFTVLARELKI